MQTTFKAVFFISTLLFGAAQATGGAGSVSVASSVSTELQSAVLLDARGHTVGTIGSNGQVVASGALKTATQVRVMLADGASRTYTLAQGLGAQARVSLETLIVRSGDHTAPLSQALRADLQAMQALGGKTVTLVSSGGNVVGTFMVDGHLRASGDLQQASRAVVTLENGQRFSYDLTGQLTAGASDIGNVSVRNQGRNATLLDVLTTLRQSAGVSTANGNGTATSPTDATSARGTVDATTSANTSGGSSIGVSLGGGISIGLGNGK